MYYTYTIPKCIIIMDISIIHLNKMPQKSKWKQKIYIIYYKKYIYIKNNVGIVRIGNWDYGIGMGLCWGYGFHIFIISVCPGFVY